MREEPAMKHVPLVLSALLAATMTAIAGPATTALPKDSVYQLPVRLTDQSGKTWAWSARRGRPQIVAMFYTSCQYICPLIVDSGKAVERTLTPGERANIGILLVSMDPARDTPDALTAVVKKRGLDTRQWTLASPAPSQVRDVANVLGVRFRKLEDGEFNHTSALILLDADGRVVARTEQVGSKADPEFLQEVRKVSHASPGSVSRQGR
jgi:protein SCO1